VLTDVEAALDKFKLKDSGRFNAKFNFTLEPLLGSDPEYIKRFKTFSLPREGSVILAYMLEPKPAAQKKASKPAPEPKEQKGVKSYRPSDMRLNTELREQVAGLRGGMTQQAEKTKMPIRFDAVEHPEHASMIITDMKTKRQTVVGLYAYRAVRQALQDLFG
jgi:hypothetical protein